MVKYKRKCETGEGMTMTEPERNRMEEMIRRLNEASEAYYGGRDEIMSNYEWDALFADGEGTGRQRRDPYRRDPRTVQLRTAP